MKTYFLPQKYGFDWNDMVKVKVKVERDLT